MDNEPAFLLGAAGSDCGRTRQPDAPSAPARWWGKGRRAGTSTSTGEGKGGRAERGGEHEKGGAATAADAVRGAPAANKSDLPAKSHAGIARCLK